MGEAQKSEGKPATVSSDRVDRQKLASLLLSIVLFALSLPNVSDIQHLSLLGVDLSGLGSRFIVFGLFLAATYTFIHYVLLWVDGTWSELEKKGVTQGEVTSSLRQQITYLGSANNDFSETIPKIQELIQSLVVPAGPIPDPEAILDLYGINFGPADYQVALMTQKSYFDLHSTVFQAIQAAIGGMPGANPELDDLMRNSSSGITKILKETAEHERGKALEKIRDGLPNSFGHWNNMFYGIDKMRIAIEGATSSIGTAIKETKRTRRYLLLLRGLSWARLFGLDFLVPALVYAAAVAHFVGKFWWSPLPSAPTVLNALHLI